MSGGAYSNGIVECYDKDQEEWTKVGQCPYPSIMSFEYACSMWLPKAALLKPLKGAPLSRGAAEKQEGCPIYPTRYRFTNW